MRMPRYSQDSLDCGFDFVVAPLVHPRYRRPAASSLPKGTFQPPFTRSDLLLSTSQWSGQVWCGSRTSSRLRCRRTRPGILSPATSRPA